MTFNGNEYSNVKCAVFLANVGFSLVGSNDQSLWWGEYRIMHVITAVANPLTSFKLNLHVVEM